MKSYTWRAAIIRSDLAPTTRHVLLTLSCHINDAGEPTYPSTLTLADECALSERAVVTHLKLAHSLGWLVVTKHGYVGKAWARNQYEPRLPDSFVPRPKPERKGTEGRSVPSGELEALNVLQCVDDMNAEAGDKKGTEARSAPYGVELSTEVPKHVQCLDDGGTEGRSAPFREALNVTTEGTEPDDKKALNVVQSNYPIELPNNDDDACARLGAVDNPESSSFSVDVMVESLTRWEVDRGKAPRFNATLPQFAAWAAQGVTPAQLRSAYDLAVAARNTASDSTAINAGFLDTFVAKALTPQRPRGATSASVTSAMAWVDTPEGVTAKAAEIGQPPQQAGEDRHWFRRRVIKALGDPTLMARELTAAERMNINEYERVHRYFYGCDPSGLAI